MRHLVQKHLLTALGALFGLAAGLALRPRPVPSALRRPVPVSDRGAPLAALTDPVAAALSAVLSCQTLRDLVRLGPQLETLDPAQMGALLDELERHVAALREDLISPLVSWWTLRNPAAATAWIQPKLKYYLGWTTRFHNDAIYAWVKARPDLALEYVRKNYALPSIHHLLSAALHRWPVEDPAVRARLLLTFPEGPARRQELPGFMESWAGESPTAARAALAQAGSLTDPVERAAVLTKILRHFAENAPREALDLAVSSNLNSTNTWAALLAESFEQDPPATFAWLESTGGFLLANHGPPLALAWLAKDPAAALDWAAAQGFATSGSPFWGINVDTAKYGKSTGQSVAPETWSDFLMTSLYMDLPGYLPKTPGTILSIALQRRPDAAFAWLRAQPPGGARDALVERASSAFADFPPSDAPRRYFDSLGPLIFALPSEAASQSAYQLAAGLSRASPIDTMTWARTIPPGPLRARAWEGIGEGSYDLPTPDLLPPGPDRDAALTGAAWRAFESRETNLPAAFEHIAQIGDPALRQKTFDSLWASALSPAIDSSPRPAKLQKVLEETKFPAAWKTPWHTRLNALIKASSTRE
jgi:hypothetical protein